ncbi:MAG TPA: AMP-binding protein [Rectinemataceae bacterium]|nr:AMP-binding protein [Rectinemataceae bacterium]
MLENYLSRLDYSSYDDFVEGFRVSVPDGFNFAYDVMDELARQKPDAPALVWCDEKGGEATFSYAQLKAWSDKTANFFAAAGIGKGDPVMLVLKRRYEFWFSILALHKLGAIAIPATHLLTAKDIVYRNKAADIKMIVTVADSEVQAHVDEAQADSPSLKAKACLGGARSGWLDFTAGVEKASEKFLRPTGARANRNGDIMLLYFTSGTTGMPKMVLHDFTYPLGHILTAKYWQNVKSGGLHLTVSDTGWAKAVWGKIYGQWLSECAVFVYDYDRFVPKELLAVVARHGVTSFCAPPTIYRFFIKEDLKSYDFSKLQYCAVAGEPLNPEVYSRFKEATGISLREGYGQTELTVVVATFPWMEPKPGSMGKPSPGYDIDIVDDEGRSCEAGEEGQIVVRTDKRKPVGMFGGYYRDQALTDSVWHDGVYYTGDMAYRDEDGYFWFIGRADDVIKSSGYRIGPFEVESALLEHPAVLECAITAVPDPDRGQVVKATVVLAKGWTAGDNLKVELQEHVKKVTAPYKYPRVVEFVSELPKTISGKIRRVEIRGGKS